MVLVKVSGLWGTSAALAEGIPTDPPKPGILRASHHQIPHRPMVSLHDIWPLETQYMNSIALIWIHIISHTWTVSEHYTLGSLLLHQLRPNAHQGHFSQTPRVLPCWRNGTCLARSGFRKDTLGAVGVGSQNQKLDRIESWVVGPPFFPFFLGGLGRGSSDCWYMLALMGGICLFFCLFIAFCFFLFGIRLWTCLWPIGLYDQFDFWRIYDHFNRFIGSSQVYSTLTVDTKVVPREKPKNSKNLSSIGRGWLIGWVLKWMKLIPTSRWIFSLNMLAATQWEAWCSWIPWVQFFNRSPPLLLSCLEFDAFEGIRTSPICALDS